MNSLIKTILVISIGFNIVLLLITGYFIYQKGGTKYVVNCIGTIVGTQKNIDQSYYDERVNLFKSIPKTNKSIIFLGDSITAGCEWNELFSGYNTKNRGIGSDTTSGILCRLDEVIQAKPDKIFLMVGISDLESGRSVQEIATNYTKILEKIIKKTPETRIYIQSILPINNDKYASVFFNNEKIIDCHRELKSLSQKHNLTYIDLYPLMTSQNGQLRANLTTNGINISGEGYLIWKEAIKNYIEIK